MNELRRNTSTVLDVVILSAGESRRLGQPKQHVVLGGQTLLQRSLNLALGFLESIGSQRKPIVISGPFLQQDCQLIDSRYHTHTINHHFNSSWQSGMASSMACARVAANGNNMLAILVDQYRLTLADLTGLYTQWLRTPEQPVAARFAGTVGPPVIWPAHLLAADTPTYAGHSRKGKPGYPAIDKKLLEASNPAWVELQRAEYDVDNDTDLLAASAFFANQIST